MFFMKYSKSVWRFVTRANWETGRITCAFRKKPRNYVTNWNLTQCRLFTSHFFFLLFYCSTLFPPHELQAFFSNSKKKVPLVWSISGYNLLPTILSGHGQRKAKTNLWFYLLAPIEFLENLHRQREKKFGHFVTFWEGREVRNLRQVTQVAFLLTRLKTSKLFL